MALSGLALALAIPVYGAALVRPVQGSRRWWAATLFPGLAAAHLSHLVCHGAGAAWVIVLYGTVEAQDSAAYLFGRLFGRHPVFPRLSPRKTWEGLLAGLTVGALFGGLLCHLLVGASWTESAWVAVTLVVAGLVGDLFTSRLKRVAGVKDFPPIYLLHGGLLDIYDSTLFAALPLSALLFAFSLR
jgi:phosphatidate cytidylyltransferase